MKNYYGSKNLEYAEGDFTINYLGYWTDNGTLIFNIMSMIYQTFDAIIFYEYLL